MKLCRHCNIEHTEDCFTMQPERCNSCCEKNIFDTSVLNLNDSEVKFCYICKKEYPLHSFIYDEGICSDSCFGCSTVHYKRLKVKKQVAEWRANHPKEQKIIEKKQDAKRREDEDRLNAIKYNAEKRRKKELEFERKLALEMDALSEKIKNQANTFDEGFKDTTSFNEMLIKQMGGMGGIYG